jgi:dTDP-4-dehydrorhamnose reductase
MTKKKILILGSSGLIGHTVYLFLKKSNLFLLYNLAYSRKVDKETKLLDATDFNLLKKYLETIKPDIIVNCIGILISESNANPKKAIILNALLPHFLKDFTKKQKSKLIHISTDCVFSGDKINSYVENDEKDGKGYYAKTKGLGEINDNTNLTLRTSVIGPELKANGEELFNWFMSQNESIKGYLNAYWSGVTTIELAKSILWAIDKNIVGLYNVTNGIRISKYELLSLINNITGKEIKIVPFKNKLLDKSFIDTRKERDYKIPSYNKMILDMIEYIKLNSSRYPHYTVR